MIPHITHVYSASSVPWSSVVAQMLKNLPAVQQTQFGFLIQEDPTCCRATRPVCHSCRARALTPGATTTEACRASAPQEKQQQWKPRMLQQRAAPTHPS